MNDELAKAATELAPPRSSGPSSGTSTYRWAPAASPSSPWTFGLDHTRPNTFGPGGLAALDAALDEIEREDVAAVGITGKRSSSPSAPTSRPSSP